MCLKVIVLIKSINVLMSVFLLESTLVSNML